MAFDVYDSNKLLVHGKQNFHIYASEQTIYLDVLENHHTKCMKFTID
jgi:hypothetical protein